MNMLAYVQGKDAYSKGCELTDNPYLDDRDRTERFLAWRKGWLDMEAKDWGLG